MSLADLFHNRAVADQLTALLAGGKLVHAFLFIGGKDSRLQIGKELAKAILCESPAQGDSCGACVSCRKFDHGNHEDFLYLDLETAPGNAKTQIGVDAVELLQEQLKLKPFGARHAVLIEEAHLLNTAAQNKLLKTLELLLRETLLLPYGAQRSSLTRDWTAFEGIREKMDQQAIARAVEAAEEAGRCIRLGYNTGYTLKQLCLSL
ncbi:MAG: hypothetical protein IJ926_00560 [Firmicutes bacterium]|nr:hypothetical protein [Bacillota bacterium]